MKPKFSKNYENIGNYIFFSKKKALTLYILIVFTCFFNYQIVNFAEQVRKKC